MSEPRERPQATQMVRLPSDVVLALRHRAASSGLTLGEAARQLMLARDLGGGKHGTIEHLNWLLRRLQEEERQLESILDMGHRDTTVVSTAIESLKNFQDEWWRVHEAEADAEVMKAYKSLKKRTD